MILYNITYYSRLNNITLLYFRRYLYDVFYTALYSVCGVWKNTRLHVLHRPPNGVILCWSRLGQMLSMELLIEYITCLLRLGRNLKSIKLIYCNVYGQPSRDNIILVYVIICMRNWIRVWEEKKNSFVAGRNHFATEK